MAARVRALATHMKSYDLRVCVFTAGYEPLTLAFPTDYKNNRDSDLSRDYY